MSDFFPILPSLVHKKQVFGTQIITFLLLKENIFNYVLYTHINPRILYLEKFNISSLQLNLKYKSISMSFYKDLNPSQYLLARD